MAITDTLSHPPGADYNTDVRPGLGNPFADPVFGENVRQLTPRSGTTILDDIYAHCWANANGTYIFEGSASNGTLNIRSVPSGALVASGVPGGSSGVPVGTYADVLWHPTNPDKYFRLESTSLIERTVSTSGDVTVHDFSNTLQTLGGSVNWCDKTGRYFIIRWGGFGRVYDRQTDTVYTGNVPPANSTGWFGMSPSGNHVLSAVDANGFHISYLINHGAQTVDTVGIKFWGCNGDHGVPVSGSDGKDYVIAADDLFTQGLFRVDVTLDQSGRQAQNPLSSANEALQVADNLLLIGHIGFDQSMHASHGPNGSGQDWVFVTGEAVGAGKDDFDQTPSSWFVGKQEVFALNYITGAIRRVANHRSRNIVTSYYYQPRVSSAWDASLVIWASNFNIQTPANYTDIYAVQNPLGGGSTPGPSTPPPGGRVFVIP